MRIFSDIFLKLSQRERSISGAVAGKAHRRRQYVFYDKTVQRGQRHFDEALADDEQGLAIFHGLAVFDQDLLDRAGGIRINLVEQLHRFDDAQGIAFLHA